MSEVDESRKSGRASKSHRRKEGRQLSGGDGLKIWLAEGKCHTGKEGERRKKRERKGRKRKKKKRNKRKMSFSG